MEEAYPTVTIECLKDCWVLRQKGKVAEHFVRWESLISALKGRISSER
jgi:hypothetical protein